jgi:PAS domain S-box-containing protein
MRRKASSVPAAGLAAASAANDSARYEERLAKITAAAMAVSTAEGEDVFEQLAIALCGLLRVDAVMIAATLPNEPGRMRTLATRVDGKTLRSFDYDLGQSPCRHMVGREARFVDRGVHHEFAPGTLFHARGFDAYAARSLVDAHGTQIGLLVAMHRQQLADRELTETLLQIFSVRAGAEVERRTAQQAARTSEQSYRAIFDASEDAIFVHDWDTGVILDVTPKAADVYGYSRDELLRLRIADVSLNEPPYTEVEAKALIQRAKLQDTPLRFEWRARHKDGHLMWHEVTLKAATLDGARRVLAFTREITERKLAHEALQLREEQYRAIFTASEDALVLWDAHHRIVDVNPGFLKLYRFTPEQIVGGSYPAHLPPEYIAQRVDLVRRALAGETCELMTTAIRNDGTRFEVELRIMPIRYRGQPHALSIARDISDRKRAEAERAALEAQLRQAQKMEAIGQLTGGIAHDFNNILASIMGYVVLASDRPAAAADPRIGGHLEQAMNSCRRARDLIQQMLTFSRVHHGEARTLVLGEVVREVAHMVRVTLPSALTLDIDALDPECRVLIDPVQAQQAVLNLCINARDALDGEGRIEVRVQARRLHAATCASCGHAVTGTFVELSVADDGPGIPTEVRERMFEPFFSTKVPGKGTGMGLATVHRIVHEHRGHVLVETESGRGTCFSLLLPEADSLDADAHTTATSSTAGEPLRGHVLVVDDESSVLNFMRELLANWGLQVSAVTSATEAYALLQEDAMRFDLLLTDQSMPAMTGVELAEAAHALRADLPVILYSGNLGEIDAHRERLGLFCVMSKPIEPAELRAAIAASLEDENRRG